MRSSKIVLTAFLLLFLPLASGAISSNVSSSCDVDEEALISLSNSSGGHAAEPDHFSKNACVSGVNYLEIRSSCNEDENFLFSMTNLTDAHISSIKNEYSYQACAPETTASIANSNTCNNGTKILEVSGTNNSHVASPDKDVFNYALCFGGEKAQNVTLTLESPQINSDVYVDETTISSGGSMFPPFAFPYIVAENPIAGIVSPGGVREIQRPESDTVSITQEVGNEFYVPFTTGSYREVDDEEDEVVGGQFLDQLSPNFAFVDVNTPRVKVIHSASRKVEGFENTIYQGRIEFTVQNKYVEDGEPTTIQITPE